MDQAQQQTENSKQQVSNTDKRSTGWNAATICRRSFFGISASLIAGYGYTRGVEPYNYSLVQHNANIGAGKLRAPIDILHLTDLHESDAFTPDYFRAAIKSGLAAKPDIALLTGDYVVSRFADKPGFISALQTLTREVPAFACLGNHDGGAYSVSSWQGYVDERPVIEALEAAGVTVLHNRSLVLRIGPNQVRLTGLGDASCNGFLPDQAFSAIPAGEKFAHLLLFHNPDMKESLRNKNWDMAFCGHTHGGQVVLPFIGALRSSIQDTRFQKGLKSWEDGRQLHVSPGLGANYPYRLGSPPEVNLLSLIPAI